MFAVTFLTLTSWGTITKSRQTRYAQTSLDFYCSNHSFAKCHKLTCCLLITQFHWYLHVVQWTKSPIPGRPNGPRRTNWITLNANPKAVPKNRTQAQTYGKAFFAKLFAARQKAGGPACNAGGFLGTSLPRQRSAFDIKELIKGNSQLANERFLYSIVIKTKANVWLYSHVSFIFSL